MPLLRLFIDICLLRATPQQVPAAGVLLGLALAAYLGVGIVVLAPREGLPRALGESVVDVVVLLALLQVALRWRRHPARFLQTATALAGSGALLGLLLVPLLGLVEGSGQGAVLGQLLWLGLFAWSLAVTGHVLRHALDLPMPGGVLCAVLYYAISLTLIGALFPPVA